MRKPWRICTPLLAKLGLEITKEIGFFELLDRLELPRSTFVFQVGASYGQELDYFSRSGVKSCILFEPIPSVFDDLCKKAESFGWTAFNTALGSERSRQQLYYASNHGWSSSLLKPGTHTTQYPTVTFSEVIDVDVSPGRDYIIRFSSQMSEEANPTLYMDTQGYELEVLHGIDDQLHRFSYIYTEVGYGSRYEGAVPINRLCSYLFDHGFEILDLSLGGGNGGGDALFVRSSLVSGR